MEVIKYPEQFLDYRPIARGKSAWQLNSALDGYNREAETRHDQKSLHQCGS
jgi:hypothetical protein